VGQLTDARCQQQPDTEGVLGLPNYVHACLFDPDGVLTQTAAQHAAAWKEMFDAYLRARAARSGGGFVAFEAVSDFETYVDGRLREEGARSFLQSRGIALPEGHADDPPDAETLFGLGNRKNEIFQRLLRERGVRPYPGSLKYLRAVRAAGLPRAVVSSSGNARAVLSAAGIEHMFDACIDGVVAKQQHLKGKPAPDTFLAGARALNVLPSQAAVFEDAPAGVEAGRSGGFGWVVGVDRAQQRGALLRHGADVVVNDLAEFIGIDEFSRLLVAAEGRKE
jgi:beta-phosphoglucomutase family hydrolase